jgi:hypothetical protein
MPPEENDGITVNPAKPSWQAVSEYCFGLMTLKTDRTYKFPECLLIGSFISPYVVGVKTLSRRRTRCATRATTCVVSSPPRRVGLGREHKIPPNRSCAAPLDQNRTRSCRTAAPVWLLIRLRNTMGSVFRRHSQAHRIVNYLISTCAEIIQIKLRRCQCPFHQPGLM